jgi:flagellin-specific chaperone FliS
MTDQNQTPERNAAGQALFQMQFALMMMNCGRMEECNTAFARAQEILTQLEEEMNG